jgi:hypothetical protein
VKLTTDQLNELLSRPDFAARNVDLLTVRGKAQSPEPECPVLDEPVAEEKRKAIDSSRVRVCIESRRTRLLDPDNLCAKYFIDSLRYAGLIPNDRAEDIELKVTQTKVKKGQEETLVEIDYGKANL